MRTVAFHAEAFEDFTQWARQDPEMFQRITRRLSDEHRLIYKVTPDSLIVVSCKYHY